MFRCHLSSNRFEQLLPHSTGTWHLLKSKAEKTFENLREGSKYKFVENTGNGKKGAELGDEFRFNSWLEDIVAESDKPVACLSIVGEGSLTVETHAQNAWMYDT
jgi:hypothetical protein